MKKLLPIIMLLVGSGAGVGAGIFLRPPPVEQEVSHEEPAEADHKEAKDATKKNDKAHGDEHAGDEPADGMEYIRLPNQFVVPLVAQERVSALVVMSLSVEVVQGYGEDVLDKEPKLRDEILRVLFDHASVGGFNGEFTNTSNLDAVRRNLRKVAQNVMGEDIVNDVLIFEIARQDY
ncbi:flagellar basal body-associated FliL family protein [Roseobacter sp. YSTF-M11]|uniref:Flagellar protein FliL n=1 Tax=Roseobacter insulae TaxID=2859783 RepID=A0A9X1JX94_9RHOB|nr:flagellar basal body-associated FliL family protein [Roseobacter insulae]MBW4706980.1 flagellar basal body-associated FliL family protein [Roseobacter insulae]